MEIRETALKSLPAGYILPMISRNIEKEFTKIVDEYLIEVYRNTLEIPTVSEGKFLNGNY